MHIIIAILTAAGGLFWALYRLQNSGVNLNSFNPFFWLRRRKWEKQLSVRPIHKIENSMDCAAVLVVAMAELDGIVTREHKAEIIELFVSEFGVSSSVAAEMYASSSHMLKDVTNIVGEVKNILAPSKSQYEDRHIESLMLMLSSMSHSEGEPQKIQLELLGAVKKEISSNPKGQPQTW